MCATDIQPARSLWSEMLWSVCQKFQVDSLTSLVDFSLSSLNSCIRVICIVSDFQELFIRQLVPHLKDDSLLSFMYIQSLLEKLD